MYGRPVDAADLCRDVLPVPRVTIIDPEIIRTGKHGWAIAPGPTSSVLAELLGERRIDISQAEIAHHLLHFTQLIRLVEPARRKSTLSDRKI